MSNNYFQFKQFIIYQNDCGMKVSTDSVLLGCYTSVSSVRRILDFGTGTGLLAIQLSCETDAEITAIDIDESACRQAVRNVEINRKENQITVIPADFNSYEPDRKFDLIISNPPYFKSGSPTRSTTRDLARYTGTLSHRVLIEKSQELLEGSGTLAICLPHQAADEVKAIADQAGLILTRNIYVYPKTGKACYLQLLFWKKPVAAVLHPAVETENITIRDENNGYTEEYRNKTRNLYLAF